MTDLLSKEIIQEWGLASLPEEKKKSVSEYIARTMYQAILVRSLDILSSPEQEELDSLLDKNETTPETTLAFLQSKIPTFKMLLKEERENLKRDLFVSVNA